MINWDNYIEPKQESTESAYLRNYDLSSMKYLRESIHEIKRASLDLTDTVTDPELSTKLKEIEQTLIEIENQLKYIPLKIKHLEKIKKEILLEDSSQTHSSECFCIDFDCCVFFKLFYKNEKICIKGFTKTVNEKIENFEPFGIDLTITLIGSPVDEYVSKFNEKYFIYNLNENEEFFQTEIFQVKDINEHFIVNDHIYMEFTINEKIMIKTTVM